MRIPRSMLLFPLGVLAVALALSGQDARAGDAPVTIQIDIGKPGQRAIPIALPYPKGGAAQAQDFWAVVKRDLELTGYFNVLDPNVSLEPADAGVEPGQFDFASWRPSGAAVLAKTVTATAGSNLSTQVWIYEVGTGGKLSAKSFSAGSTAARALAHRVANEIVFAVTGKRSFFDTRFAFSGKFGDNKEIYLCDADGYGRRSITKNGSINLSPRWSPTGASIAYTGYAAGNPDLYVADLAKGQIRRLAAKAGINTGGSFGPGGSILALTQTVGSDSEIFTIDAASGAAIARLTSSPGIDVSPTWSPDGSQIAFVSERSGGPQIYIMNKDGSGAHRATFQGGQNTSPSWSPKGDRIAFVGRDGHFDVFTVKPDGSGVVRVTQGQGDNEDPSFSPEGDYVAFSSTRSGSSHIWVASADGDFQTQITSGGGGYSNPNWSPHLSW
jgi:TolB protein